METEFNRLYFLVTIKEIIRLALTKGPQAPWGQGLLHIHMPLFHTFYRRQSHQMRVHLTSCLCAAIPSHSWLQGSVLFRATHQVCSGSHRLSPASGLQATQGYLNILTPLFPLIYFLSLFHLGFSSHHLLESPLTFMSQKPVGFFQSFFNWHQCSFWPT